MTHGDTQNQNCCPRFDPEPWDEKTHIWEDKLFIKDSVRLLFHQPLPSKVAKMTERMWQMAQDAGATPDIKDFLMLAHDPSPWKGEFYIAVTKEVPGIENVRLSGEFLSKVFDGPYNAVPKWVKEMNEYLTEQGKPAKKYYFYFTTCPRCAKVYGHNYAVAFVEV